MTQEESALVERLHELMLALGVRGVGHTRTMQTGTQHNDCIVVAHTAQFAKQLAGKNGISLDEIYKLRGQRKPLAIDHHVLQQLFRQAAETIVCLSAQVEEGRKDAERYRFFAYNRGAVS